MTKTKPRSDIAYLCRALKAPSMAAAVEWLAEKATAETWSHEEFLAACLDREVSARQTHGGEARIRTARFPAHKTLEDFDFSHQRSVRPRGRRPPQGRQLPAQGAGPRAGAERRCGLKGRCPRKTGL